MSTVLALDQGTTSSRALLFSREGRVERVAQAEFTQHYRKPGWVEHDPEELWESQSAYDRMFASFKEIAWSSGQRRFA